MKFKISREQLNWGFLAFFVLAAATVFIALLLHLQQVAGTVKTVLALFTPFYIGFAIAYLLNPIMNFWEEKVLHRLKKLQMRRTLSMLITYALFLIVLGGSLAYLVPRLITSLTDLINEVPAYYTAFVQKITAFIEEHPNINAFYNNYSTQIEDLLKQSFTFLSDYLSGLLPMLANVTLRFGGLLIKVFVGIIISIYFLHGKERLIAQCKKMLNFIFKKEDRYEKVLTVGKVTHEKTLHYITARLLDSLIVAAITYLFMIIFKVPYALISALVVGVFNTIPYFGSWLGAIPPAIIVLIVKPGVFIPYIIFIILLEQLDGNVIGPKIQGKQLGLSALWIIFAIFLFGGIFGVFGMVVGVPLFAVIYYFVTAAVNNGLSRQGKSTETVDYAAPEDREFIEETEKTES